MSIQIETNRDANLTDFSKAVLEDRYVLTIDNNKELIQELFKRVAEAYKDNDAHGQRIYDYMSRCWFMPASPVLANAGSKEYLPISCFLSKSQDTMNGLFNIFTENMWLSGKGGGVGIDLSNIRSVGEGIKNNSATSKGIFGWMKMYNEMFKTVGQALLRNGGGALYLNISHPEIVNFISSRKPTAKEEVRCLDIHHAVTITDEFMRAVEVEGKQMMKGEEVIPQWNLKSPKDGRTIETVSAFNLWTKILETRIETGEPYITFQGNVDKNISTVYKKSQEVYGKSGLRATQSNMCNEILLHTGLDQFEKERTAVCCLSSLNLEYFEEWKDNELFIEDIMRFLDNILTDFINRAPDTMERAKYSAMRERSVGLGVMGFHSFLQSKNTPIEGVAAKSWNKTIFKHIKEKCDLANETLANDYENGRTACPDAKDLGLNLRFSNCTAIAPTASISIICGNSSPGIEPYIANCYTHKTLSGTFIVRNKHLAKLLESKGKNTSEVWSSISMNEGSIMHLDFLTPEEKDVFKTAMELNQMWLIDHAADRQPFIDQGQSLNVFLFPNAQKSLIHKIHFQAWKKGIKGLYYCRSKSLQRAEKATQPKTETIPTPQKEVGIGGSNVNDECLACQ